MIQAEIDAAAELIDFFRFNAKFAVELEGEQPISVTPSTNRVVYRGLEVRQGRQRATGAAGSLELCLTLSLLLRASWRPSHPSISPQSEATWQAPRP